MAPTSRYPAHHGEDETLSQAYDLHKMLDWTGEGDNSSSDDSSDWNSSDDGDGSDAELESNDNGSPRADDEKKRGLKSTSLVNISFKDSLLLPASQTSSAYFGSGGGGISSWPPRPAIYLEKTRVCANVTLRHGMWATNPRFHLDRYDMGFLSQLSQLCFQSNLRTCEVRDCLAEKEAMDRIAPSCRWSSFRQWALVAMSCQASMDRKQKVSRAHTHIVRAVSGICLILRDCLRHRNRQQLFIPHLDGQSRDSGIDLKQVSDLIYWMARIQSQLGVGPRKIGKWDHHFIPTEVTLPSIGSASMEMQTLKICKNRLWNLVNVSDRKQVDLPDIVHALAAHKESLSYTGHDTCSPGKCKYTHMNSTSITQLHKCKGMYGQEQVAGAVDGCSQIVFPVELLDTALELGKSTAWLCQDTVHRRQLSNQKDRYIAISHVWSDGTGVGVKEPGSVNECLFGYFASLAHTLGCNAVWWDVLSIPLEPKARLKALSQMHNNYANSSHTVVHDSYLVNFPWSNDEGPCLALVLSTWFTRGWTALELAMSNNVKVLFKDPRPPENDGSPRPPLIKDLDRDVLAQSPARASRAHWLATSLIQRLRRPINNVGDLVATLAPRSTSWVRDRTVIAALLSRVPDCELSAGESQITEDILKYVGWIPHSFLLHGKSTMRDRGPFSWSAATLDDIPVDATADLDSKRGDDDRRSSSRTPLLEVTESGSVKGTWWCRAVTQEDIHMERFKPYGSDLSAMMKVNLALQDWGNCVLLWPFKDNNDTLALVVSPTSIRKQGPVLKCRYVGTVMESRIGNENHTRETSDDYLDDWSVEIGSEDVGGPAVLSKAALKTLLDCYLGDIDVNAAPDELFAREVNKEWPTPQRQQESDGISSALTAASAWTHDLAKPDDGASTRWGTADEASTEQIIREKVELCSPSLLLAIRRRRKQVIRYLVHNRVRLAGADLSRLIDFSGSSRRTSEGLKMLGDTYMESGSIDDAISAYLHALNGFDSIEPETNDQGGHLDSQSCRFALGHAYVALATARNHNEWENRPGLFYARDVPSSNVWDITRDVCLEKASELFEGVLRACDEKSHYLRARDLERRQQRTADEQRLNEAIRQPEVQHASDQLKRSSTATRLENDWLRLEFDTVAELALLRGSSYEFKLAAKAYKRAIRHFGTPPQELEGFKVRWPRRRIENFGSLNERDRQAAEIYNRALRRFNTLLRADHPLIPLTNLQLGVNYSHQSKMAEAEDCLKKAARGFRDLHVSSGSGSNNVPMEGQHPMLKLAQYYLGVAYSRRHKHKEARRVFKEAGNMTATELSDNRILRAATMWGLAQTYLDSSKGRSSHLRESLELTESAYQELQSQLLVNDEQKRLALELRLGSAKALYELRGRKRMEKAEAICDEVVYEIRTNLDNYGARGDLDEADAKTLQGRILQAQDRESDAKDLFVEAKDVIRIIEGTESLEYLKASRRIGNTEMKLGHYEDAEEELTRALEGFDQHAGAYDQNTLKTALDLAKLCAFRKQFKEATRYGRRAYEGMRKVHRHQSKKTARAASKLGRIYFDQCRFSEAKDMFSRAYDAYKPETQVEGKERRWHEVNTTLSAAIHLAEVLAILGGPENDKDSVALYRSVLETLGERGRQDSGFALYVRVKLADVHRMRNQLDVARPLINYALEGFEKKERISKRHASDPFEAKLRLAQLILDEQQQNEYNGSMDPINMLQEALAGLKNSGGPNHRLTLEAKALLGEIWIDEDHVGHVNGGLGLDVISGERYLKTALEGFRESFPRGYPMTIRIMDILIKHWRPRGRHNDVKEMMALKWDDLKEGFGADHAAMIMQITDPKRESLFYMEDEEDVAYIGNDGLVRSRSVINKVARPATTTTGPGLPLAGRAPSFPSQIQRKPLPRAQDTNQRDFTPMPTGGGQPVQPGAQISRGQSYTFWTGGASGLPHGGRGKPRSVHPGRADGSATPSTSGGPGYRYMYENDSAAAQKYEPRNDWPEEFISEDDEDDDVISWGSDSDIESEVDSQVDDLFSDEEKEDGTEEDMEKGDTTKEGPGGSRDDPTSGPYDGRPWQPPATPTQNNGEPPEPNPFPFASGSSAHGDRPFSSQPTAQHGGGSSSRSFSAGANTVPIYSGIPQPGGGIPTRGGAAQTGNDIDHSGVPESESSENQDSRGASPMTGVGSEDALRGDPEANTGLWDPKAPNFDETDSPVNDPDPRSRGVDQKTNGQDEETSPEQGGSGVWDSGVSSSDETSSPTKAADSGSRGLDKKSGGQDEGGAFDSNKPSPSPNTAQPGSKLSDHKITDEEEDGGYADGFDGFGGFPGFFGAEPIASAGFGGTPSYNDNTGHNNPATSRGEAGRSHDSFVNPGTSRADLHDSEAPSAPEDPNASGFGNNSEIRQGTGFSQPAHTNPGFNEFPGYPYNTQTDEYGEFRGYNCPSEPTASHGNLRYDNTSQSREEPSWPAPSSSDAYGNSDFRGNEGSSVPTRSHDGWNYGNASQTHGNRSYSVHDPSPYNGGGYGHGSFSNDGPSAPVGDYRGSNYDNVSRSYGDQRYPAPSSQVGAPPYVGYGQGYDPSWNYQQAPVAEEEYEDTHESSEGGNEHPNNDTSDSGSDSSDSGAQPYQPEPVAEDESTDNQEYSGAGNENENEDSSSSESGTGYIDQHQGGDQGEQWPQGEHETDSESESGADDQGDDNEGYVHQYPTHFSGQPNWGHSFQAEQSYQEEDDGSDVVEDVGNDSGDYDNDDDDDDDGGGDGYW